MKLEKLPYELSVCKLSSTADINLNADFFFIGKTDDELSLVCITQCAPETTLARKDGWKGFRIEGTLDFSLIGILSEISSVLADNGIGIFAGSTYDTDYILVKDADFAKAARALRAVGIEVA